MNREILLIAERIKVAFEGDPWYGKSAKKLLSEVDEQIVFEKPSGEHSILELLWHMITWKEFTISRFRSDNTMDLNYFEKQDWRELDHSDKTLWKHGLEKFYQTQNELITIIKQQKDELLSQTVNERKYDFRELLYGIIEHDIYHLGQIAYIKKMLEN